jgi:hypothetical protein
VVLPVAELELTGRPHWPAVKLQLAPRRCWPVAELGRSGVRPLLLVDVGSSGAENDDTNKRAGARLLCLGAGSLTAARAWPSSSWHSEARSGEPPGRSERRQVGIWRPREQSGVPPPTAGLLSKLGDAMELGGRTSWSSHAWLLAAAVASLLPELVARPPHSPTLTALRCTCSTQRRARALPRDNVAGRGPVRLAGKLELPRGQCRRVSELELPRGPALPAGRARALPSLGGVEDGRRWRREEKREEGEERIQMEERWE